MKFLIFLPAFQWVWLVDNNAGGPIASFIMQQKVNASGHPSMEVINGAFHGQNPTDSRQNMGYLKKSVSDLGATVALRLTGHGVSPYWCAFRHDNSLGY